MSTLPVEPEFGPCVAWTDGEEVAAFCPTDVGSDTSLLDEYALAASELLFELSGRRFNGECSATVRPCRDGCSCWNGYGSAGWPWASGVQWGWGWNGTYGAWDFGWFGCGGEGEVCGCRPLSQVELAGYPVTAITEVLIDGAALATVYASDGVSPTYRIDMNRYLVRMNDPATPDVAARWPACQNLALPTTESGTWSVTYLYGQSPPTAGVLAAKQLACQLYNSAFGGDCILPAGATRVTRQGITMDRTLFLAWGRKDGMWQTGLPLIDSFLQAYNPIGTQRRPAVWSPDTPQMPRHTGS